MKKSLLALAVLGAFAGAAQAQTNVSLYGVVDIGVATGDSGVERKNQMSSGNNAASRWGIKGTEDLGNGLKANFVLESGFDSSSGQNSDDDNFSTFSRLSWVGLGGGFGEVRLGRQDSQAKQLLGDIDTFGAAGMANAHDYFFGDDGITQRRSNLLTYLAPNFGGITGGISYGFGEVEGDSSAGRYLGARIGYANGPINVQFSYENERDDAVDSDEDVKDYILGATYNFGMAKLHAAYGQRKDDGADDFRSALLGVTVPFGASAIRADYIRNDNRDDSDGDSNMMALSYTYALSKRTAFYATYVRTSVDDGATLGVAGNDYFTRVEGEDGNALAVGVTHKF